MPAGYSTNPLYRKLGIKEGFHVKLVNAPDRYALWVGEILTKTILSNTCEKGFDFIHFFTNDLAELERRLPRFKKEISKDGMIWISWYKKAAGKPTGLDENIVRDTALHLGLVDVKVCAVDEQWSGLKLVYRLKDRQAG
jgi:hypothetical protein